MLDQKAVSSHNPPPVTRSPERLETGDGAGQFQRRRGEDIPGTWRETNRHPLHMINRITTG